MSQGMTEARRSEDRNKACEDVGTQGEVGSLTEKLGTGELGSHAISFISVNCSRPFD
jgi:hypothetical protein